MTDNVIEVDFKQAHQNQSNLVLHGAECIECMQVWRFRASADFHMGADEFLQCPTCDSIAGVHRAPPPDQLWRCNCGCSVFFLNPEGTVTCAGPGCGAQHTPD